MSSIINASTSGGGGIIQTADASGILELQSGGVTKFTLNSSGVFIPGHQLQVVSYQTGAVATGTTLIINDDTVPQNTEGNQYMSLAITPLSATSKLLIQVVVFFSHSAGGVLLAALFQDSTANALATMVQYQANATASTMEGFNHYMTSGTTSSTTFKVRLGCQSAGTTTFNGVSAARLFGGSIASSITITEIAV